MTEEERKRIPDGEPVLPKEELALPPSTFPEGGLQAWATVAGAFVKCFPSFQDSNLECLRFIIQFCGFGFVESLHSLLVLHSY
jgi:hypothetical protein